MQKLPFYFSCLTGVLTLSTGLIGAVHVSEFMADNMQSLQDADESTPDWLEVTNNGSATVDLSGWALSDDAENLGQWIFPSTVLSPGQSIVIFASGKDWRYAGVELHTNFKLSASSDSIILSQPDGAGGWTMVDSILDYPEQVTDVSYGVTTSTNPQLGYFEIPTPGQANAQNAVQGFAGVADFSHGRGYYTLPFTLNLSSSTIGATLIYTLDGSRPSLSNGIQVQPGTDGLAQAQLAINDTTLVRACAAGSDLGISRVITHSYIFADSVLGQSASDVPGSYGSWGHSGPDWSMDPAVTEHANPEDKCVAEDFYTIPTVSIAMKWSELFGAESATQDPGIYLKGEKIRKEASFELINPEGFDEDPNRSPSEFSRGQILVFGGSSTAKRWKTDKLSFRFNFEDKLESPVFGDTATGSYDRLVLDARLNNVWNQSQNPEQRQFGDYTRDAVLSDLDATLGRTAVHSQHVHLFLNGLYWGIYTLHERPDNHFAAAYLGGDSDDYDVVKHDPGANNFIVDGLRVDPRLPISNTNHTAAINYLDMVDRASRDLSIPANLEALAEVLDIPALRDHILTNFYGGNYDWPQHNWYATYNRVSGDGKWRFHSWDAEHVFKYEDYPRYDNVTNKFEGWDRPDGIHLQLLTNPDYRMDFADAAHRYLFNGGPFAVENVWALFEARFTDIDQAIRAESARWGDNGPIPGELHLRFSNVSNPNPTQYGKSDTTDFASWYHERERIRTKILGNEPNRATRFLDQMRNAVYGEDHPLGGQPNPLYPSTDAPVLNPLDEGTNQTLIVSIDNPNGAGTIYYTTDGTDPRQPGSGSAAFFSGDVNSTAQSYSQPVSLESDTVLKSRILLDGTWSALNEVTFDVQTSGAVPATSANLALSEIHYHPTDPTPEETAAGFLDDGLFEFFEVLNISEQTLSLEGITVADGVDMVLLSEDVLTLAPGERALFVSNVEAFTFRYGEGLPIAGVFTNDTALSNGGEQLRLNAADGSAIFDVTYDDKTPWPVASDGDGPSMVLIQPGVRDAATAIDWRASDQPGGTPGTAPVYRSYVSWINDYISSDIPDFESKRLPESDPDSDGMTNLEELLLGTDPNVANPEREWLVGSWTTSDSGLGPITEGFVSLHFQHPAEGVEFSIETSADFINWEPVGDRLSLDSAFLDEAGFQTRSYKISAPISGQSETRFFRIRLTPH